MSYWGLPGTVSIQEKIINTIEINTEQMIVKVCNYYGITLKELTSKRRFRNIVDARHTLYYIFYDCCKYTSTYAGKLFNQDHSTVLHGSNKIKNLMSVDKKFRREINKIINKETIKHS